jgi:NADH-quinone oxidoreductase subunit J
LLAVTSRRIFRSAVWLLSSLVGIAGIYFWLEVEFIAATQIIVYVGGIVVLILFSIFLTQESGKEMPGPRKQRIVFSILATLFGFAFTYSLIARYHFPATSAAVLDDSVSTIGMQMLSTNAPGYLLPFEVVSMLLLSSMIGCIVIATKPPGRTPPAEKQFTNAGSQDTPSPADDKSPPLPKPVLVIEEVEHE